MPIPISRIANPLFGRPILTAYENGRVAWTKASSLGQFQKGTGYQARLYGGVQTNDDWAACYFPVDEIFVSDFKAAQWSWYQRASQTMGLGIVIWIHDPNNFDNRAEVTQLANTALLDKSAGWNSHEWLTSTKQMLFYGENTTGTALTAGTQYTWAEFQADKLFKRWTIYRVSFDWGWEASGTFADAYLAEVKLNNVTIPLFPSHGEALGSDNLSFAKATVTNSTTKVTLITPTTGRRIRVSGVQFRTTSNTEAVFEMYYGAGANMAADYSKAIATATLDKDVLSTTCMSFGDCAPLGLVDEVVSMRTSADIVAEGLFIIRYREE